MKNKHLVLVFVLLLVIWGASSYFFGNRDKNFQGEIITVDTTEISSFSFLPKGETEEIILKKEGTNWLVSKGVLSEKAVPQAISMIFKELASVKANRIVAKTPEKWQEYEVTDSLGTLVRLFENDKLKDEFVVGRFSFNPQTQSGTSFVRLTKGSEVFAVDGFLAMAFMQGVNMFRDRSFLKLNPSEIQEISRFESDSLVENLTKQASGIWQNTAGKQLDSSKMETYLNGLAKLDGSEFADDFDPAIRRVGFHKSLKIRLNNQAEWLEIGCLSDTLNHEKPFLLNSSQHSQTWFLSDSAGLFRQVFVDWNSFISVKKK